MLTQIWSALTDIISGHFLLFCFTIGSWKLKFGKNIKKHLEILSFYACVPLIKITCTPDMMYGSWDMKFNRQNHFVILANFLPFYPPNSPKKWKYQKWKKTLEILSCYTSVPQNHDHPLYCSRDAPRDGCNFYFSLWATTFCPFIP